MIPIRPGAVREEIERVLADPAIAGPVAAGAPVALVGDSPARVLWANPQICWLFGLRDLDALTARLLAAGDPGSVRLAVLADALAAGPARLERLRFFIGHATEILTVQVRRAGVDAQLLAICFAGLRPSLLRASGLTAPLVATDAVPAEAPVAETAALPESALAPDDAPAPVAAEPAPPDANAVRAELAERFGGQRAVRFLWQTDAQDRIVSLSQPFLDAFGASAQRLIGQHFNRLAGRLDLDPSGALLEALAGRATWSGVEVFWPIDGTSAQVPVLLGAIPAFDRTRSFEGWRGFGVIQIARIEPALPRASATGALEPAAEAIDDAAPASVDIAPPEPEFVAPTTRVAPAGEAAGAEVIAANATDVSATEPHAPEPEPDGHLAPNVVPLRPWQTHGRPQPPVRILSLVPPPDGDHPAPTNDPDTGHDPLVALSSTERLAFREIARALGARIKDDPPATETTPTTGETSRADAPTSPVANETNAAATVETPTEGLAGPANSDEADAPDVDAGPEAITAQETPGDHVPVDTAAAMAEIAASLAAHAQSNDTAPEHVAPALAASPEPVAPADPVTVHARDLLDRAPLGMIVSRGGFAAFINRHGLDLLGFADADAFHAAGGLDRMFRGRVIETFVDGNGSAIPVIDRHGEVLSVEGKLQKIEWDGAPACLMTFRRSPDPDPVAQIRSLEHELRQRDTEARELRAILDTATDGVAVLDDHGHILSLNRSGEALFGYDQNEVAGENFSVLVARDSQTIVTDYFDGLKSSAVASLLNDGREIVGRARQGGAIPLFMTLGRLNVAGESKFCAVMRDLTAWKKVERDLGDARREAERASALKSDFLAKVSHEIRTPLNAILGFAEVIIDERFGPVGNERYKDYLKDIHASGEHVMSLVNDLLDLSKIEAGKMELNSAPVDANRVIAECVSLMQPQANTEHVVLRPSLTPNLPNILADERSLRQIVLNLLSNAVKFNEPGGQVIITTARTDAGHVVLRVRDTGIGMSESDVQTALEPFRQLATSRQSSGTGLGLPLTKALVEANRASFAIRSKKKEGTLVEVTFPPSRVLAE